MKQPVVELLKNFPTFDGARKDHYLFGKDPSLVPILSQINPVTTPYPASPKINFHFFHPSIRLGVIAGILASGLHTNILHVFLSLSLYIYICFSPIFQFVLYAQSISSSSP
jgi:hypothetical protein